MKPELTAVNSPPYRPATGLGRTELAFVFNAGGIGDYINWVPAVRYAIDKNPHIFGYVLTPKYFEDLAHLWFDNYDKRFVVQTYDKLDEDPLLERIPFVAPDRKQFANANGFHLMHLGFVYYNQISKVPKNAGVLPVINGSEADVTKFNLPEKYAVVTVMATAENRKLPAEAINSVTRYLITKGITTVFLGKREILADRKSSNADGITLDGVLDLRDKTTLPEAACIMARAKCVVGLDNGLLHLACCTSVPVVFIFTSVDPALRVPPRHGDAKTVTVVPDESLKCRFCNSRMQYIMGHDFKNCLYGDNFCATSIKGESLIPIVEGLLEDTV